jgi:hypothetical protein
MGSMTPKPIEPRVIRAAETALADHRYVSPIDILTGIGWLAHAHVRDWQHGRVETLESSMQVNPNRIAEALVILERWAGAQRLRRSDGRYSRATRNGTAELRFTAAGDPESEQRYRAHYASTTLPERSRKQLDQKLQRDPAPVVFQIGRDSRCSECGAELEEGRLLFMDAKEPLCLPCANMDALEYLPAGDAAMTRRATKYSSRTAVVVRFSRSRGRYERQGILVEVEALQRAERECSDDADVRARQRAQNATARSEEDRKLKARMTEAVRALFPGCPDKEAAAIAAHTAVRGSGRVGRTAAGRSLDPEALTAAVTAAVRHRHTEYDDLLASGCDRTSARERVAERVREVLDSWRAD